MDERDRNEPDLFGKSTKAASDTEQIAYLGDPNVVGAVLRDAVASVMYVVGHPDVTEGDKAKKLQRECKKVGSILLGTSQKADFAPIPNWNQPGAIDVFCAKWCGSSETSAHARMEHAVLKMMMEMMELAKYASSASEEESKWQFDAIIQTYTGIFMGISPPMQAMEFSSDGIVGPDDPEWGSEKAVNGELIMQKSSEPAQMEIQHPVFNINLVVPPDSIRVVVEQQVPNIQVNVPEQPAPVINVESQPVNVEVKVPEQPAPNVTVEAPVVNVTPQIDVIVPQKRKPKKATITHSDGSTSEIEVE